MIYVITNCLRNEKTRDWLKTKNNNILQAIKKVCRSKLVQLRFTKIKSHSGDIYNDLADTLAKEESYEAHSTTLNNISSSSIKYIPEWKNLNLETPLRAFIKKIVQTMYKADWTWLRKKNDEEHQTRVQKQNWKAFKGILESCCKQFQNSEANHVRLFKIKCIENLLPTVEILNSRKPQLYKNSLYKRCAKEKETISHLITCEKTNIVFRKIEKEVWEQLYKDKRREEGWDLVKLRQAMQYNHEKKYQKRKEWI